MTDLQAALRKSLSAALGRALGPEHEHADPAVHRSAHADFQADAALRLAKELKRSPRDVARAVAEHLELGELYEKVEIAGPGVLKMTLSSAYLERTANELLGDERLGVPLVARPDTVVLDYSGPNVAKELHVGHLRPTIIGDALARVLEFLGHRVIRQNHIGDWGTPFGMLIEHLLDLGGDVSSIPSDRLNAFYQEARGKFDADPSFAERSRLRVVALQSGDETTLALWRGLVDASKARFQAAYERLGVTLAEAHVRGESFYNDSLPDVASELERAGLARVDAGALCVFPPGFTGRDDKPVPVIVRKQDGGYGYAATDLAALRYRVRELGATRLLYVVGAPQQQHFAMVFAVARLAGWLGDGVRAEHVQFGSILGPDRKMLRTRSGESVTLVSLLDEAEERAGLEVEKRFSELDLETRRRVARQVGVGAIKYTDLSSDRLKDYVFDWSRMLAFEGNTGGYLQYAHARIASIFRKAGTAPETPTSALALSDPAERALVLELAGLGPTLTETAVLLAPHKLCSYLYGLATTFSTFYDRCPVLRAETTSQRESRLALCALAQRTLARGLDLLGIEAPEHM